MKLLLRASYAGFCDSIIDISFGHLRIYAGEYAAVLREGQLVTCEYRYGLKFTFLLWSLTVALQKKV